MLSGIRMSRRLKWISVVGTFALLAVVLIGFTATRVPFSSEALRQRVISTLSTRLNSEVELQDLVLRFQPRLHVLGTGLTIRHRGRHDVPPMIAVRTFTVDAS